MNKAILIAIAAILIFGGCVTTEQDGDANADGTTGQNVSERSWSPFGIADVYSQSTQSFANELGARSIRLAGPQGIVWEQVKKNGWNDSDRRLNEIYRNGLEMSVVVLGGNPAQSGELDEYSLFIASMAERYDGDGIDDAPGSPVVAYWEIDNEPDFYEGEHERTPWKGELSETKDYALVLKTAYNAIKSANPDAKVAIAGMAGTGKSVQYYESIFQELEKIMDRPQDRYFDAFNFHIYADNNYNLAGQLATVNGLLGKYGYENAEIIITETGIIADLVKAAGGMADAEQAKILVKRYVYLIANGVDMVYWFNAQESLLTASGDKRLSYYSYRKMTDILDGSDFMAAQDGDDEGVHLFKSAKNGKLIWVAWVDGGGNAQITITGIRSETVWITEAVPEYASGNEIAGYAGAFSTETMQVEDGAITLEVGDAPVYIGE